MLICSHVREQLHVYCVLGFVVGFGLEVTFGVLVGLGDDKTVTLEVIEGLGIGESVIVSDGFGEFVVTIDDLIPATSACEFGVFAVPLDEIEAINKTVIIPITDKTFGMHFFDVKMGPFSNRSLQ